MPAQDSDKKVVESWSKLYQMDPYSIENFWNTNYNQIPITNRLPAPIPVQDKLFSFCLSNNADNLTDNDVSMCDLSLNSSVCFFFVHTYNRPLQGEVC